MKDPSYGKVFIDGEDCTNIPIYERATRFKLDMCPHGGFIQDLSLLDNLKLVAEIHIKEKDIRKIKIEKIISQFEFDPLQRLKENICSWTKKETSNSNGINK